MTQKPYRTKLSPRRREKPSKSADQSLKSTGGRPGGAGLWLIFASYTGARLRANPEGRQGIRDVFKCCNAA